MSTGNGADHPLIRPESLPPLAPAPALRHSRGNPQRLEAAMDYSKSGNAKSAKDSHHPLDVPRRGAPKAKETEADRKAALLARMKAAAEAKKKG
jgi:hypothetical protein